MQGTECGIESSVQCIGRRKSAARMKTIEKSAFIVEKVKGSGNTELRLGIYDE
jgi:hypothetical protein